MAFTGTGSGRFQIQRVINGIDGLPGAAGDAGDAGARGAGRWSIGVTALPTTTAEASARWDDGTFEGGRPGDEQAGDQAWFYLGTISMQTSQVVWIYNGIIWTEQDELIDGNLLVTGTVTANSIATGTLTSSDIPPAGTQGAFIANDGTAVFGNPDFYVRWDGMNLDVQGELSNVGPARTGGRAISELIFAETAADLSLYFDGAGVYFFLMTGGGGGGCSNLGGSAAGGGAPGVAAWTMSWDGVTNLSCDLGIGGTGVFTQSDSTITGQQGGNDGGTSTFSIGGTVFVTCTGGGGGLTLGGTGGTATFGTTPAGTTLIASETGAGTAGGNVTGTSRSASGGGGSAIPLLQDVPAYAAFTASPVDFPADNTAGSGGGFTGIPTVTSAGTATPGIEPNREIYHQFIRLFNFAGGSGRRGTATEVTTNGGAGSSFCGGGGANNRNFDTGTDPRANGGAGGPGGGGGGAMTSATSNSNNAFGATGGSGGAGGLRWQKL